MLPLKMKKEVMVLEIDLSEKDQKTFQSSPVDPHEWSKKNSGVSG